MDNKMASPTKKMKAITISDIRQEEKMIDIILEAIVCEQRQVTTKNGERELFTLVTSDGMNYIQVIGWGTQASSMARIFGDEAMGNTFAFRSLECHGKTDDYNYGSTNKELSWREGSVASSARSTQKISSGGCDSYFSYLLNKIALEEDQFQPIPLEKLKDGEALESDFDLQISKISALKQVELRGGMRSQVMDIELVNSSGRMATLTAWNIYAQFLDHVLKGNEGNSLHLRSKWRNDGQKQMIRFTFSAMTRMSIIERAMPNQTPTTLKELADTTGVLKLSLRVKIIRAASVVDIKNHLDGTIATDGVFKAQLFFPSMVKLKVGNELELNTATIAWAASGVLSLTVHHAEGIKMCADEKIRNPDLADLEYPPNA